MHFYRADGKRKGGIPMQSNVVNGSRSNRADIDYFVPRGQRWSRIHEERVARHGEALWGGTK